MRTLHIGLRVTDLDRSLAFYTGVGYEVVGRVPDTPFGSLTMLTLPGDEFVSLELVHDPDREHVRGDALHHLVIQVESMPEAVAHLAERGIAVEDVTEPDDPAEIAVGWITDPDGQRIELVRWPAGHPAGMTAADFEDAGPDRDG